MVYFCRDCGEFFEDPKMKYDKDFEAVMAFCPWCDSYRVEEAGKCECCGKSCDPEEDYCKTCGDGLYKVMDEAVNKVMDLSDEDYVDSRIILANYIEEVWNDSQGV